MRIICIDWQFEDHSLVGEKIQRKFTLIGGVVAALYWIRYIVHCFLQIKMYSNVVLLHFIFTVEHKEIVSILWYSVSDLVRQTGFVEIGIAAMRFAKAMGIEGQTEDEA